MITVYAIGTNKEFLGLGNYEVTVDWLRSQIGSIVMFKGTPTSSPDFGGKLLKVDSDEYEIAVDVLLEPLT